MDLDNEKLAPVQSTSEQGMLEQTASQRIEGSATPSSQGESSDVERVNDAEEDEANSDAEENEDTEESGENNDAEEGEEDSDDEDGDARVPEDGSSSHQATVPGYTSDDHLAVLGYYVTKFENEESLYFPFPGVKRPGGKPSKPRAPKQPRIPPAEGASLVTERHLRDVRLDHLISHEVEFRCPTVDERADDPPEGYFTFRLHYITHAFTWFPIPEVVITLFSKYKICLAQVTPQSFRNINAILVRSYEERREVTLDDLSYMLKVSKGSRLDNHYLSPTKGNKLISGYPSKDHHWEHYFFFIKINNAAIEGDLSLVRTEWRWRGRISFLFCFKLLLSLAAFHPCFVLFILQLLRRKRRSPTDLTTFGEL